MQVLEPEKKSKTNNNNFFSLFLVPVRTHETTRTSSLTNVGITHRNIAVQPLDAGNTSMSTLYAWATTGREKKKTKLKKKLHTHENGNKLHRK